MEAVACMVWLCSIELLFSQLFEEVSPSAALQVIYLFAWLTSATRKLGVIRACIDRYRRGDFALRPSIPV